MKTLTTLKIMFAEENAFTARLTNEGAKIIADHFDIVYDEDGAGFKFHTESSDIAWMIEDFLDDYKICNASVNA